MRWHSIWPPACRPENKENQGVIGVSMTEEEQIAQMKDWWQRNGKPLLTGGALALAIVVGWQAWQQYQTNQAQGGGALYQQLLETTLTPTGQPDAGKVTELADKLKSEYGGSAYAQYASLFVAKVAVDNAKLDDAVAELKPLVDKPADATIGELARQRLARVLAAQGKTEDGLKLLEGEADKAWQASREELKGDLLVQLGRSDEAHAAYQKAKDSLSEDAAVGGLQMKLDDLAKGDA
ncbi:tetratricopeptide repeat protein [Pseudomonas sp. PDM15]|nr:tetratricopeptide repeat protein [Pseudomonas sp. PDM15]